MLAWGAKVSPEFCGMVLAMCERLRISEPSWCMACMAFETGRTFTASVRNAAGSGAVGLIQFMPTTAGLLGTTTDLLAAMTPEHQLDYVERYFAPWKGRLECLGDVYGAILWPAMIGKPDASVVFDSSSATHPKLYLQNRGLDFDNDGKITKGEVVARVQACLSEGLLSQNASLYAQKVRSS